MRKHAKKSLRISRAQIISFRNLLVEVQQRIDEILEYDVFEKEEWKFEGGELSELRLDELF